MKRFYFALLFALCSLPSAFPQMIDGISNDGTMSSRWQVGDDGIGWISVGLSQDVAPNNNIDMQHGFTLGTHTFIPGWQNGQGFQIAYDDSNGYTLIIDNLQVRSTLAAYELLLNQLRATNGNQIITSAGKIDSATYNDWLVNHRFKVEDVTGAGVAPFAANDIIMAQSANMTGVTFDGSGDIVNNGYLIKRLVYKVDSVSGLWVYYSSLAGAPSLKGIPAKGDVFVRIGNTTNTARQGVIGLYSDEQYAPYIRVTDGVDSWADWKNTNNIKFQAGRLYINDPDFGLIDTYGLYTTDGYFKGKIKMTNQSSIQISGFNNDAGYITTDNVGAQTYYGASAPGSPAAGDFWFDTSVSGSYIMKRYNGSTWQPVSVYMDGSGIYAGSINAGQITAGAIYGFTGDFNGTVHVTSGSNVAWLEPEIIGVQSGIEYSNLISDRLVFNNGSAGATILLTASAGLNIGAAGSINLTSSGGSVEVAGSTIATQPWVSSQGYITSGSLSGYATEAWVNTFVDGVSEALQDNIDALDARITTLEGYH
jgi:hypothetical protein